MSIAKIIKKLPQTYASDVKVNLINIFESGPVEGLSVEQVYGIALTAGYALGNEQMLNAIRADAKLHIEEAHADACKMAVVLMAMNNMYYRFTKDLLEDSEIKSMESNLSMELLSKHNINDEDFEVFCLAASIIGGCKWCIAVHSKKLTKRGMSKIGLRNIARIVSVINAAVSALELEGMRSYDFASRGPNL
ncbi:MAG: carboxymuconolactone decarboxylase family protein [Proteobacteria bacterium]|nr:carboxymuconolactone decarboxylase family protein [Pseudomonadota bacterium]